MSAGFSNAPNTRNPYALLLRARRERPSCYPAAEQRDEIAPLELIKLHPSPPSREVMQRSEIAKVSQALVGLCDNLSCIGKVSLRSVPGHGRRQTRRL